MGLRLVACKLDGSAIGVTGHPLPLHTDQTPQVTIPLSDSRTGQMDVSMYEPIAGALTSAQIVVKVLYRNPKGANVLVLNGIVLTKHDDFDAGTTTVQLHDSTIRLKKRYLGYNHYSIMLGLGEQVSDPNVNAFTGGSFNGVSSAYGIPLDGTGVRLMLMDASHGASDWPGGGFSSVPALGIRTGKDNANRQPLYGSGGEPAGVPPAGFSITANASTTSNVLTGVVWPAGFTAANAAQYMAVDGPSGVIPDFTYVVSATGTTITLNQNPTANSTGGAFALEAAAYCQLSRGDCVYDDITQMVQAQGGFECDWIPVDATNLGFSGAAWLPGQLCELYTDNRVGTDRSQGNAGGHTPVVFVHGEGGFHLQHEPDANQLITYIVEVGPGGPTDALDEYNKAVYEANTVDTYGIWESWVQATSAGTGDTPISNQVLTNRAAAVLTAYQQVPQFCTASIDTDSVGKYAYGTDFFLGDTVTVYAKKGYVTVGPVAMRIISIGISQKDPEGNCKLDLTLVPHLTANPGISNTSL